jgi:membrane protease YdiL (CAAX protease family)
VKIGIDEGHAFTSAGTASRPPWSPVAVIRKHPLISFFVIAYAFTYAIDLLAATTFFVLIALATFGPLFAAVVVTRIESGWAGVRALLQRARDWRVGIGWYAVVVFGFLGLYLAAMELTVILGGKVDFGKIDPWYTVPLLFLVILLVGGPVGEEFGWRGFALPRLSQRGGPLMAALVLGLPWALWHLPNWWVPHSAQFVNVQGNGNYVFFIGEFVVFIVGLSIVFAFVYFSTGASVLMVLLLHASINTWDGWLFRALDPSARVTFFVCENVLLWVLVIAIIVVTRGRLTRDRPAAP